MSETRHEGRHIPPSSLATRSLRVHGSYARRVLRACAGFLALVLGGPLACNDVRAASVEQPAPGQAVAVFAGGCFWCMEADFEKLPGVFSAVSGYAGGTEPNPTYEQVSSGRTGHAESVRVTYDPAKLPYAALVDYFFRHVDPTQPDGQFCDLGRQYRTVVFVANEAERKEVERVMAGYVSSRKLAARIVTEVLPAGTFWPAEEYHQDYARKSPGSYGRYRLGCGRDARIRALWGDAAHATP